MATLVVLAAGLSTRFGAPKQLVPVGPGGEALLDYALFDAARAGFRDAVIVTRPEAEPELRRHVGWIVNRGFPVRLALQTGRGTTAAVNAGVAGGKPWGTGHAVLAAAPLLTGPFAVCNADDFYGAEAYSLLRRFLDTRDAGNPEHALVAYHLQATLSPHGGVSRGIVERAANGYVTRVTEVLDIARRGATITGRTTGGATVPLSGAELVSMNLWGFTPAVFPVLQQQSIEFQHVHAADPDAELLLSSAMDEQVASGRAKILVLETSARWLGMTYAGDAEGVRGAIAGLVASGAYPETLQIDPRDPEPPGSRSRQRAD